MWRRHAPLTGVYGNSNCIFHPATRPCKPASGRKNFKAVMRDRRCPFHNSINSMPNARVAFLAHLSLVSPRFVGLELLAWGCLETRPKAYSVSEPSFRVRKCNSWQASKVTTWKDTAWDECDTIEIRLYVRVTCVGLASVGGAKVPYHITNYMHPNRHAYHGVSILEYDCGEKSNSGVLSSVHLQCVIAIHAEGACTPE